MKRNEDAVKEIGMTQTTMFAGPFGEIAVHESDGVGQPIVLIHGNSCSARAFSRQLEGRLGASHRLVAIDLMGHGRSANAGDAAAYLLSGHARSLVALLAARGIEDSILVGWSLGGHILLEAAPDLPRARGLVIFGTPPIGFPPAMDKAFLPNPAMQAGFLPEVTPEMAEAYVAAFFAPGFADVPPFFLADVLRTDGTARAQVGASIDPAVTRDEVEVAGALKIPLAILHGAQEQLVNGAYFGSLKLPTLWRGATQIVADAGHAPQWERPDEFDALLRAFAADCGN
jgi:pimeloyl-ACP methyl ester carboxylesterase